LPDIESIAAGSITEIDVPQFSDEGEGYTMNSAPPTQAVVDREEAAYDSMVATEETSG